MTTEAVLAGTCAVRAGEVTKVYGRGPSAVTALDRVSLGVTAGAMTVVMGPPGSGKSTLLQCLAGLEDVTAGEVFLGDLGLHTASEGRLSMVRRDAVGFVFDGFNLLPALTVAENILAPSRLAGMRTDPQWVQAVVDILDLAGRLEERPANLTGGEQQRVAIARALITRPQVLFADDPSGSLDYSGGEEVLATLRSAVDDLGQTVVLATRDPRALSYGDQVVLLAGGRIADQISPGASARRR
ncbi:ABC transporter ATP-binding protein [Ruania zhangjianzhongii]|uniref:ABC transporter ATP-binding protein n=1 Tax=Ruania zhangjianzhongii TaxID=2603206 RepID=UPI0011C73686|nr:ABC transporter ATP-binding protein [Ruania zhangjianzhongii]